jgi:TRAP transporter TAXI family solute receptor
MSRFIGFMFAACLLAFATSISVSAAGPDWPKSLTLGTASPGGAYYIYGDALAQILTEKLGITVNPLPNQGTVHNVMLVDSGGIQVGLITMGVGLEGWTGTGDWTKGQKFRQMRALFPMYDTPFQPVVLRRSGITTIAQLDNKRLGIGRRKIDHRALFRRSHFPAVISVAASRRWRVPEPGGDKRRRDFAAAAVAARCMQCAP